MTLEEKLRAMVGCQVQLETKEGFNRNALLTDVRSDAVIVNGEPVAVPLEVVLSDDDPIPVSQLRWIRLA